MDQPLISVIVPVYNVESYLCECIDSILGKSYQNIEVILVDDGSTDRSGIICDGYSTDSKVRVIHQSNQGVSVARNTGIMASRGQFVGFVDSDDVLEKDAYRKLFNAIGEDESIMVANGDVLFFDQDNSWRNDAWALDSRIVLSGASVLESLLSENTNHFACTKLFHRSLFDILSFTEGRLDEDTLITYEFGKMCISNGYSMVNIPDVIYRYRQRVGSACNDKNTPERIDRLHNLEYIKKDLTQINPSITKFVDILYVRSLELFVNQCCNNKRWSSLYLPEYRKRLKAVNNTFAKEVLARNRYKIYMFNNYTPVFLNLFIRRWIRKS